LLKGHIIRTEAGDYPEDGGSFYDVTVRVTGWSHFRTPMPNEAQNKIFKSELGALGLEQKVSIEVVKE
jgi:hypothetical protein